jgi:predicted RNA polymerase sigma factor
VDGEDTAGTSDGGDPSGGDAAVAATDALATVREEAGRLAASVTRVLSDFDAAEEVVQDALLAAFRFRYGFPTWPRTTPVVPAHLHLVVRWQVRAGEMHGYPAAT